MLYFWITNASRAHRAGKNDGSGSGSPVSCSPKKHFRKAKQKETSMSPKRKDASMYPSTSYSEPQLDQILQKPAAMSSVNGSNSQIATSNGSVDVSSTRNSVPPGQASGISSTSNQPVQCAFSYPFSKSKIYKRKTSSSSLWL